MKFGTSQIIKRALGAFNIVLGLGCLSVCNAAIINGNFESGLSSWESLGKTGTSSTATQGKSSAYIEAVYCNVEPVGCIDGGRILGFMGANFQDVYNINQPFLDFTRPESGSAIKQTFVSQSHSKLTFDYRTLSNDVGAAIMGADFTFFVLDGSTYALGRILSTTDFHYPGVDGYLFASNWETLEIFVGAGTHTLSFGAIQGGDTSVATAILIDNVRITGNIPEPPSIALALIALCGAVLSRRRNIRVS
jgi:hypothetical protein